MMAWGGKKKKDQARARELFRLAAGQDPKWPQPREALGRLAMETVKGTNYEEAISEFDRAIELANNWAKPYEGRGWCYLKSAPPRLNDAIQDFEKAQQLGMNTKSMHKGLGMALRQRGEAEPNVLVSEVDLQRAEKEYELAGESYKRENP